jgi:hypothetical protein
MSTQYLLNEILGILREVKDDKKSLEKILSFLNEEIVLSEEPKPEVPEKFNPAIQQIVGAIDAGMICFLNLDTLETEDVASEWLDDDFDFEMETGVSKGEMDIFKHEEWENCLMFEPLDSHESFRIMENFAAQLKNIPLQNKLINALNNRKPFANFKFHIDNSGEFRQQWFDFKQKQLKKHVKTLLEIKLRN